MKKGFSIIFALLIVGIVASVGLSVFEIFSLELAMTGSIRESQRAFYAADAAGECVLYWDLKNPPPLSTSTPKTITCNNENKTVGGSASSGFQLLFSNGSCVNVIINIDPTTGQKKIESLGRSKYSGGNCDTPVPQRTERGLEIKYD